MASVCVVHPTLLQPISANLLLGFVPVPVAFLLRLWNATFCPRIDGSTSVCEPYRVWMLRHVAMGYSTHLQRLLGGLTWGVFPYLIDGYKDHTLEGSHLRSIVFESCEVYARSLCFAALCAC